MQTKKLVGPFLLLVLVWVPVHNLDYFTVLPASCVDVITWRIFSVCWQVLKRMIAFLTVSVSGGGYHKFRVPRFDHHPPPGLSIPADSYVSKTVSHYTLSGTLDAVVKSGAQCSEVDGSWGGGSFIRNVGIFLPYQQQAQPKDSCTTARTSDLAFRFSYKQRISRRKICRHANSQVFWFQSLENFSILVLRVKMISIVENLGS